MYTYVLELNIFLTCEKSNVSGQVPNSMRSQQCHPGVDAMHTKPAGQSDR